MNIWILPFRIASFRRVPHQIVPPSAVQYRLQPDPRRAFTLVELLVVISIITLIASTTLFTLYGVREDAKERRARAQVAKIHELLMQPWESYRTRPVPTNTTGLNPNAASFRRLRAIRELMRMELPDRKTDLLAPPRFLGTTPAIWRAYTRRARQQIIGKLGLDPTVPASQDAWINDTTGWTPEHESAECLYLILASMRDGNTTGLDFFSEGEIGDADNDGMPEILDPWEVPIYFLRWAPGFRSDLQLGDMEPTAKGNAGVGNGDPFDPLRRDPRWSDGDSTNDPFLLFPLAVSAGRDKQFDLVVDLGLAFDPSNPPNPYAYDDPYAIVSSVQLGATLGLGIADNITSHFVEVR